MKSVEYEPIGVIRTPYTTPKGTPIQPGRAPEVEGTIELRPEFVDGLSDLDGFSHVVLIYHLHLSEVCKLRVVPFLDDQPRGLFATRAPKRPNPIGLSVVKLSRIEGNLVYFTGVDMIDGTPLLDIKPYVPAFDDRTECRFGWLEGKAKRHKDTEADDRFEG